MGYYEEALLEYRLEEARALLVEAWQQLIAQRAAYMQAISERDAEIADLKRVLVLAINKCDGGLRIPLSELAYFGEWGIRVEQDIKTMEVVIRAHEIGGGK